MNLERHLRDSLAARDPGADFEEAVMAQLARQPVRPPRRSWHVPATLVASLVFAGFGLRWYSVQQREAHAHQQLLLAMQITSYELNQVQRKLVRHDIKE